MICFFYNLFLEYEIYSCFPSRILEFHALRYASRQDLWQANLHLIQTKKQLPSSSNFRVDHAPSYNPDYVILLLKKDLVELPIISMIWSTMITMCH